MQSARPRCTFFETGVSTSCYLFTLKFRRYITPLKLGSLRPRHLHAPPCRADQPFLRLLSPFYPPLFLPRPLHPRSPPPLLSAPLRSTRSAFLYLAHYQSMHLCIRRPICLSVCLHWQTSRSGKGESIDTLIGSKFSISSLSQDCANLPRRGMRWVVPLEATRR